MSTVDDGGSAFPITAAQSRNGVIPEGGLTKREWFAGLAMQVILTDGDGALIKDIASTAYLLADAMIDAGKVKL